MFRKLKVESGLKISRARASFAAGLVLMSTAFFGTPASAAPRDEEPVEIRIGVTLEDSMSLGYEDGGEPGIVAFSIPNNPLDTLNCDFGNNADWVIAETASYAYNNGSPGGNVWPGGDLDLLCGTDDTSGFKHIRERHQYSTTTHPNSWSTVKQSASNALGYTAPQTWDEFMWHAVTESLNYANPFPQKLPGDKVCFSTKYRIFKGTQIYSTFYVNTIVSSRNFTIITAYPSDNSNNSDCIDDH